MFDTIKIKLHCIWCSEEIEDWQTKDLTNTLEVYNIEELKKMKVNQPGLFEKTFSSINKMKWIDIIGVCSKCNKMTQAKLDLDF